MPKKISKDPNLVFRVAQLFFEKNKVSAIAERINRESQPQPALTRESVYPLLAEARAMGFVKFVPPVMETLGQEIARRFDCHAQDIRVVFTADEASNYLVAQSAAELALELVKEIATECPSPIGLGLGPGRATLDFCQSFSKLLDAEARPPKLRLHAIAASCPPRAPEYSPTSFFNLFSTNAVEERVGLFAETIVSAEEFDVIKNKPNVEESFKERDSINLIVTSMGDIEDEHDLLRSFLEKEGEKKGNARRAKKGRTIASLRSQGCVGNVQYRPYSKDGPISEKREELRAVTLFELKEFVELVKKPHHYVLLIARQCGPCRRTRAQALLPLLENPALRVWSKVVMDAATAHELLQLSVHRVKK